MILHQLEALDLLALHLIIISDPCLVLPALVATAAAASTSDYISWENFVGLLEIVSSSLLLFLKTFVFRSFSVSWKV